MKKLILIFVSLAILVFVTLILFFYRNTFLQSFYKQKLSDKEYSFQDALPVITSECEEVNLTPQNGVSWNIFDGDHKSNKYISALFNSLRSYGVKFDSNTKTFNSAIQGTIVYIEAFSKKENIEYPINRANVLGPSCWIVWVEDNRTKVGILAYKTVSGVIKNIRVKNFIYLPPKKLI